MAGLDRMSVPVPFLLIPNAPVLLTRPLKVVVVACTQAGDVDIDDVRAKIAEHGPRLAAIIFC